MRDFVGEGKTAAVRLEDGAPVLGRSVSGARGLECGEAAAPAVERSRNVTSPASTVLSGLLEPASQTDWALRCVDLAIGYAPGQPVREHLDVEIPAGVSTVITGPNGVGKSTLALTLAGLLPQLAGRVEAGDDRSDPHSWSSRQLLTRLGFVFQQPEHQFVTASVRAELAVGLQALKWPTADVTARVDELLGVLHLDGLADANPFTLSGGEKRRLSVGTVLATGPQVIILDEPTFGQDRTTWCDMVGLIRTLLNEGRTVVSVTHDQALMDALGENRIDLGGAS